MSDLNSLKYVWDVQAWKTDVNGNDDDDDEI